MHVDIPSVDTEGIYLSFVWTFTPADLKTTCFFTEQGSVVNCAGLVLASQGCFVCELCTCAELNGMQLGRLSHSVDVLTLEPKLKS